MNFRIALLSLRSSVVGYGVVMLGAALTFLGLQWLGITNVSEFIQNPEVKAIIDPTGKNITVSLCGTLAGCIIVAAYRRSVIAGALIAMVVINATAMIGLSLACGQWDYAWQGLQRVGADVGLIFLSGVVVFGAKQWLIRKRKPLV
jgi:Na+/phosphate symporter